MCLYLDNVNIGISGLVVEYIVAIDVTRVRFPADALIMRFAVEKCFLKIIENEEKLKANGRVRTDDLPLTKRVLYR